jgi:hypothetical protein
LAFDPNTRTPITITITITETLSNLCATPANSQDSLVGSLLMKKSLLIVLVGLGVGYVLGARAGRERYDLILEKVTGVWEDPRVAKARREAARYAREQAPVLRDKAQAVAKAAPGAVKAAPGFVADRAKATTAAAKDVADRTVASARGVADRTAAAATSAAATAANRVGEVRDAVLATDEDGDDEQQF